MHIDGSRHQWFQDERWYDLIVILDDASSEIYYAQLVEEESTATVMAGLKEVIGRKGVFCALYSDRGSHFWLTPKVGGEVDYHRRTQVGRAVARTGSADDPGVFAGREPSDVRQLLISGRFRSHPATKKGNVGQGLSKLRQISAGSDFCNLAPFWLQ